MWKPKHFPIHYMQEEVFRLKVKCTERDSVKALYFGKAQFCINSLYIG